MEADMAKKQKNWKIMVYLAGNNNLAEEMVFALREMYRVGSRSDFDLVVQFDTGGPPRRFHVTPNPLNHVAGDVLKPYEPAKEEAIREALAASRTESRAREDQDFH